MKKLLFYSHDSYGLGNIRRMVAIADFIVSRHRDVFILLITGSPMLHAFRTHPQIDYIKLPCLQRSQHGVYSAKLQCFNSSDLLSARSDLIQKAVSAFEPDLVLVDKKPEGLSGELKQTLLFLSSLPKVPRCVLLLRDILDAPEVTKRIWNKNAYYQLVEKYYDQVLVVGERRVFDLPHQYQFPAQITQKTQFCGYLQRSVPKSQHSDLLGFLAMSEKKLVVAAAGGGEDGRLVLQTYLHAVSDCKWQGDINSVVFYGPEMSAEDVKYLQCIAASMANVTLMAFTPHFISYLAAADLVVAMGGYNTVCEVLSVKKPAIIIPRITPVSEQLIRAQCFSRLEVFEYLHPDELTPEALAEKVASKLFSQEALLPFVDQVPLHGMEKLERHLLS
ncbi:glycosyltransferase family protein [Vibrio coralliilyticus]|uniref:glycosyltransferase family protein n=1 Tax=Vibrio coralliilyticus TaxID=190893 RepID=UPI003916F0A2